ncbi:MAG: hypothetical protein OEU84_03695 [Xanthomonadales bacterium]|nr:hypothetical protein [Xanthomonadales bacterium]
MTPSKKHKPAFAKGASGKALEKHLKSFRNAELCCQEGEKLLQKGGTEVALRFFQRAVQLDSRSMHGWFGQGMAFTRLEEFAESIKYFRKVIKLGPKLDIAHHNLGRSLHETGQADSAYQCFSTAIDLGLESSRKDMAVIVPGFPSASNSTVLLERSKWADGVLRSAEVGAKKDCVKRDKTKTRLKIAYVSAFFHRQNWMKPVWGLVGQHDREKFEIHLFSDRTKLTPEIEIFLEPGDRFHDMSQLSNKEAADLIHAQGIDILVDLNGYSYPERFPIFLEKPAALIVGWFNMYATTGFSCFDYLIGDDCVIPPEEEQHYCEKIVRVDGSYLTFTVGYNVPDVSEPPCIATGFVTFGSLISQYKITDQVIDTWCEILHQSPGSRLLIRNAFLGKASNRRFLEARFRNNGIAGERISLQGPADHYQFLETYNQIDVALDAFPYNGGTTTTEAIWQGVPVVTYRGDRWVSRTSATLLRYAGLETLVAKDQTDYIRLATELAGDPERLVTMRREMRDKLSGSKVCDTADFARSMEKLYLEIWQA